MSQENLQAIVGMAIVDREFRGALLARPRATAEAFDLTEEELALVGSIRAKTFEQFAARLDLRISKLPVKQSRRREGTRLPSELSRLAG